MARGEQHMKRRVCVVHTFEMNLSAASLSAGVPLQGTEVTAELFVALSVASKGASHIDCLMLLWCQLSAKHTAWMSLTSSNPVWLRNIFPQGASHLVFCWHLQTSACHCGHCTFAPFLCLFCNLLHQMCYAGTRESHTGHSFRTALLRISHQSAALSKTYPSIPHMSNIPYFNMTKIWFAVQVLHGHNDLSVLMSI